jgi:hypothetical protein
LSDMKLKKVHDKVLQLSNLRTLDLSKNALTDIPEQLGSMAGMKQFNVSYNDIPQLPLAVWSLPLPALFACFAGSIWCRLNLPARAAVCGVEELLNGEPLWQPARVAPASGRNAPAEKAVSERQRASGDTGFDCSVRNGPFSAPGPCCPYAPRCIYISWSGALQVCEARDSRGETEPAGDGAKRNRRLSHAHRTGSGAKSDGYARAGARGLREADHSGHQWQRRCCSSYSSEPSQGDLPCGACQNYAAASWSPLISGDGLTVRVLWV